MIKFILLNTTQHNYNLSLLGLVPVLEYKPHNTWAVDHGMPYNAPDE